MLRLSFLFACCALAVLTTKAQSSCDSLHAISLPDTLTLCRKDSLRIPNAPTLTQYLWGNNQSTPYHLVEREERITLRMTLPGCTPQSRYDTLQLRFQPKPRWSNALKIDTLLCFGDSLVLHTGQQENIQIYSWTLPFEDNIEALDSNLLVVFDTAKNSAQVYPYVATLFGYCTRSSATIMEYMITDTAYVFFAKVPSLDLGPDSTFCPDDIVELKALAEEFFLPEKYQILWGDGENKNTNTIDTNKQGMVNVSVWNRCFQDSLCDTVDVRFWPSAWTESPLIKDTAVCEKLSVELFAAVPYPLTTYLWLHDSSTKPTITASAAQTYTVVLRDSAGCERRFSCEIRQDNCDPKIEVPNIFTPNGDGVNDVLFLLQHEKVKDFRIRIFNRWGGVVYSFEGDPEQMRWDGKNGNTPVPEGTYYWVSKFQDLFGKKRSENGSITILR